MSRYNDRNFRRDRSSSPVRVDSRLGRDNSRERKRGRESKRGRGSTSPSRGDKRYKNTSDRRDRSTSRNGTRQERDGRHRTPSRGKSTSPRGERGRSSRRELRDRLPSREDRGRNSSLRGRRIGDRSPPRVDRNRSASPRGRCPRDRTPPREGRDGRSLSRGRRNRSPDAREGRDRSPQRDRKSSLTRRGRDRTPIRGARDMSPRRGERDRSSSPNVRRDRNRTSSRGEREMTPSLKGRSNRNRSAVRGERSRDGTPSRRGRDIDRSQSRTRSGRGNSRDRDSSLSTRRERKRSRSTSRTSDRHRSRSAERGNRKDINFEDLNSSQLSKWFKEVGLSTRQIEDMERERVTARYLQKMSEREISKIIGDDRMASTVLREVDYPSKDILEAATRGEREMRDEDYVGKLVKVDERGRMEDARVLEIVDRKYWKVKLLDSGKCVEVRKSDLELPKTSESRRSVEGLVVTVRTRRGKREGTIERDNKDGTFKVEFRDGSSDRTVPKEDIDFPSDGGGDLYDLELDELEGVKLDVGGGYMAGNPEVRIHCGSQRKEVIGRGSDPKFKGLKFSDVDCGKVRELIFELHSRGMMRTSKVAEVKFSLRDVLDEGRGMSEQITFYNSKDEKKGKLLFRINCKLSKSKIGGGKHGDRIEVGAKRNGVTPRLVYNINGTDLIISEGDLLRYTGDAIVNCCDPECLGKSGLSMDRAINAEGGYGFEDDREDLKKDRRGDRCPIGSAVIMSGGKLGARNVIHAAAPKFSSRSSKSDLKELESLYKDCINKAIDENCRDVAFCLLPPMDWHGGLELEDVVEVTLESLKYELKRGSSLEEVHLVASSRAVLRVLESEADSALRDYRSRKDTKNRSQLDFKTSSGKIYQDDFIDTMKKLQLSNTEATILFEYHDKEDEGYVKYEDFLSCYSIVKDKPDDLERVAEHLKDRTDEIIQGYKSFVNKNIEAKWKERERGLEGWLPATILRVNSDGTFEVEYDEKDRYGRRLLWENCPKRKIKLPAEERSKFVVAVKRGSGFPSGGWMSRSKPEYTVCIFGDKGTTELARTKPQSGSSPDFNEKITFSCTRDKYRDLRFEVQDNRRKMIMDGFFNLDDRLRRGRSRTEYVKLKSSKSSGDSGSIEVTVVSSPAFSVRDAFSKMADREGEVTLRSALRFISDNGLGVKEDLIKDVFYAIDKRDGDIITLKEFIALNPACTAEDKDFVDAILNFEQGAESGAGREKVKKWTGRDVEDWLEKKGWSKYRSAFKRVDGFRLLGLTAIDLEDMGVDRRDAHDILRDIEDLSRAGGSSNLREWTEKDVTTWLTKQGFKRYTESFIKEAIDGRALLEIDQRNLVDDLRMDWRDAKELMTKLDELTRDGDRKADSRDRRSEYKEADRRRGDDDRRNVRDTRGGDRTGERDREPRREPAKPYTVVFQFGVRNTNSTREMEVKASETPLDVCEKIHLKFLKNVAADQMELMYEQKPVHPTRSTIGEIGVKEGERMVVRRRK